MPSIRQISMRCYLLWALIAAAGYLSSFTYAWAANENDQSTSFRGMVRDSNGQAIPYAWVKAKRLPSKKTVSKMTDINGNYRIENLTPGSYTISASRLGYRPKEIGKQTHQGQKDTLNFTLQRGFDPDQLTSAQWVNWIAKNHPEASQDDAELLQSACSGCHNVRIVANRRGRNKEEWQALIYSMTDLNMMPVLNPPLMDKMTTILEKYFGPDSVTPKESDIPFRKPPAEALRATYIEYDIPLPYIRPHSASVDKQDRVWITGYDFVSNSVAMFDIASESFQFWEMPVAKSTPHTFAFDDDGKVWIPESWSDQLGVIDPETGKLEEYKVPSGTGFSYPHSAAIDKQGHIWITCMLGEQIAEFDPQTKKFKLHPIPKDHKPSGFGYKMDVLKGYSARATEGPIQSSDKTLVYGIDIDSQDNIWFSEYNGGRVVKLDRSSGKFIEYKPELIGSTPRGITVDSNDQVWFANFTKQRIGVINPSTGTIKQFQIPSPQGTAYTVKEGPKGKIWYSDFDASLIGNFDPKTEKFIEFALPTLESTPRFFGFDSQNHLWYSQFMTQKIGVIIFDSK